MIVCLLGAQLQQPDTSNICNNFEMTDIDKNLKLLFIRFIYVKYSVIKMTKIVVKKIVLP